MQTFGQLLMVLWIGAAVLSIAWGEVMIWVAAPLLVAWIIVRQVVYRRGQQAGSGGESP